MTIKRDSFREIESETFWHTDFLVMQCFLNSAVNGLIGIQINGFLNFWANNIQLFTASFTPLCHTDMSYFCIFMWRMLGNTAVLHLILLMIILDLGQFFFGFSFFPSKYRLFLKLSLILFFRNTFYYSNTFYFEISLWGIFMWRHLYFQLCFFLPKH